MPESLVPQRLRGEKYFRWRGGDVSRVEALSDAAYAFAITLLVVSLEVPDDIAALKQSFLQIPAFLASFLVVIWFWYHNFLFHRRYGLEDWSTIAVTVIQLFVVLVYVYPLKFLFTGLIADWFGQPSGMSGASAADRQLIMILYGGGFVIIMLLSALQNFRALRLRKALQLDEMELFLTKVMIRGQLLSVAVGVISIICSVIGWSGIAGVVYALLGPIHGVHGYLSGSAFGRRFEGDDG